jgi:hypothetical protein
MGGHYLGERALRLAEAGLASLLLAGCGGPAPAEGIASLAGEAATTGPVVPGDPGGEVAVEEALFAFTACLREEGIDVPDPELDANGNVRLAQLVTRAGLMAARAADQEALREAFASCREHLEGVALRFAAVDRTDLQDRLLAYSACMRQNGFDLPDPDFSASSDRPGIGLQGIFPGVGVEVFQDPAFQEANGECQGVFAGILPDGGGAEAGEG